MDAKKEETKWPDNARLKMLDKAQFYEPNEKIYHYGFYDGYQFCKEEYASPLKERIKELTEDNKNLQALVQKHLDREYFESTNELHDYIEKLQSQLKEADSKAVRLEEFIKTHIINYNKSPLTAQGIQMEAKKLFEQENK